MNRIVIFFLLIMGIYSLWSAVYYLTKIGASTRVLRFTAIPPTPAFIRDPDFTFQGFDLFREAKASDRWYMLSAGLFHLAKGIILFIAAHSLYFSLPISVYENIL